MTDIKSIGVLGAGAWGTALALTAARAGNNVVLWGRDATAIAEMRSRRVNSRYLPGITFDEDLEATTDIARALSSDLVLLVTPAQTTRAMCTLLGDHKFGQKSLLLCAKGIERSTGKLPSQTVSELLPGATVGMLSGPSFADDVARGLPTAVTIGAEDLETASHFSEAMASPSFRPYASDDLIGVQVGGALKNVLAIACGAVVGRKLGASALAALTARGFAELTRLGAAMGGRRETMTGLSGLGDLVLTCSSPQSRNFSFGIKLGQGTQARDLIASGTKLAEGAYSARIAVELGERLGLDLPICKTVAAMIDKDVSVDEALSELMARPLRCE